MHALKSRILKINAALGGKALRITQKKILIHTLIADTTLKVAQCRNHETDPKLLEKKLFNFF
ncbi:hypothetical protein BpHYR1_001183 [Brachionus plicatilis]|uniref:Uncharacterized protein n=1 Tax=Brachionus plicatilis TaxID=10195 RepID=A0A3M7SMX5_BRAPC|nr:hypothetical protein BpHYR1_001183 [Brachionus plicatilis]